MHSSQNKPQPHTAEHIAKHLAGKQRNSHSVPKPVQQALGFFLRLCVLHIVDLAVDFQFTGLQAELAHLNATPANGKPALLCFQRSGRIILAYNTLDACGRGQMAIFQNQVMLCGRGRFGGLGRCGLHGFVLHKGMAPFDDFLSKIFADACA